MWSKVVFTMCVEVLTKHKLAPELSGLGSTASGKPGGAGGAKESKT